MIKDFNLVFTCHHKKKIETGQGRAAMKEIEKILEGRDELLVSKIIHAIVFLAICMNMKVEQ